MKSTLLLLTAAFTATATPSSAQDQPAAPAPAPAENPAAPSPQAEREAVFVKTLTNATFNGRFCMIQDGQLSPEREEKYTIQGVTKGEGDKWTINAEIAYAGKKFTIPVPVVVKWAGDTPVIIVSYKDREEDRIRSGPEQLCPP